jgi:RHH-type rel operon transcriptional repressor/antitoxin RelB
LTPEIEQRLSDLVKQAGRTKEYYLQESIERGLEDVEDYYLATMALERVRKGEERVYSSEEVKTYLGLEG